MATTQTVVCTLGSANNNIHTLASGSLASTATNITGIPAGYSYLILQIVGASSDTATRQPIVQVDTDNGASFDTTAGNYVGKNITTATLAANTLASLVQGADVAAASLTSATIYIYGYHAGPQTSFFSRSIHNTTEYTGFGTYIGTKTAAINALSILWNGSGSFDAGTYVLYGVA